MPGTSDTRSNSMPTGSAASALRGIDRGLLRAAEFFFGPRESWEWWQRRLRKAGLLDD